MEPNNFEKNVQRKMEELEISPSDSVWANIEKRIGKKHKDRKVIFILSFLILFLLSGGYWIFNSTKENPQHQPVSGVVKSGSTQTLPTGRQTNNADSSLNQSLILAGAKSRIYDSATGVVKKATGQAVHHTPVFQNELNNNRSDKRQRKLPQEYAFTPKEKRIISSENKGAGGKLALPSVRQTSNDENEIVSNNTNNLSSKESNFSATEIKAERKDSSINIGSKIHSDSLARQLKTARTSKAVAAKNDSSIKRRHENPRKRTWTFGVTVSGGTSLLGASPLGSNNNNSYYPQNYSLAAGVGGFLNRTYSSFNASPLNHSFAFIGGVFAEKNISPKAKVSLGISYKYFSLINTVGTPTGFALYQFSASNNINSYRNNFHYLELPVSMKFQINNSKTWPLYWQAGINISQLISSNALQFQYNTGYYYKDNSLFNKTQLGLSTGLSATVFAKQKVPVTIGPYFYYSPSKLAGKGLYGDKHFSFIGIRAEISFRNK